MNYSRLTEYLLFWYDSNSRDMPWRGEVDPYKIWLSEIMLQQTQVATVRDYYLRWIKKFPTIRDVATANLDELLKMWEGLGYYSRVRNFHKACKALKVNSYQVPNDINTFQLLSGVGPYISSAVQSIAFNEPTSVIDGNVNRVVSRFFSFSTPPEKNRKRILEFMNQIIDKGRPGDFNQAIMDLGRYICRPKNPLCSECPINTSCKSFAMGTQELYPAKVKKKKKPHFDVAVGIIWDNNKLLITKRKEDGLLGGLWEFPGGKMKINETPKSAIRREIKEELSIKIQTKEIIHTVDHHYSHFSVTINAVNCHYNSGDIKLNGPTAFKWINTPQLQSFAFPKASIKLFDAIRRLDS